MKGENSLLRNEPKPITDLVFGEGCRKKKKGIPVTQANFFDFLIQYT